jgi:hypothetical protein
MAFSVLQLLLYGVSPHIAVVNTKDNVFGHYFKIEPLVKPDLIIYIGL